MSVRSFNSSPRQAITWLNADLLLTGPFGSNFSEIRIGIQNISFRRKCIWKGRLQNRGHFISGDMSINIIRLMTIKWSLLFTTGPFRGEWPVITPHKRPVMQKVLCHDVILVQLGPLLYHAMANLAMTVLQIKKGIWGLIQYKDAILPV